MVTIRITTFEDGDDGCVVHTVVGQALVTRRGVHGPDDADLRARVEAASAPVLLRLLAPRRWASQTAERLATSDLSARVI